MATLLSVLLNNFFHQRYQGGPLDDTAKLHRTYGSTVKTVRHCTTIQKIENTSEFVQIASTILREKLTVQRTAE